MFIDERVASQARQGAADGHLHVILGELIRRTHGVVCNLHDTIEHRSEQRSGGAFVRSRDVRNDGHRYTNCARW